MATADRMKVLAGSGPVRAPAAAAYARCPAPQQSAAQPWQELRVFGLYLTACLACGLSPARIDDARSLVGFRLFTDHTAQDTLAKAIGMALAEHGDRDV